MDSIRVSAGALRLEAERVQIPFEEYLLCLCALSLQEAVHELDSIRREIEDIRRENSLANSKSV